MAGKDKEVQERLRSITAKVREIEESSSSEIRVLTDNLQTMTKERDALLIQVAALRSSAVDVKSSQERDAKKLRIDLAAAQTAAGVANAERDQLQRSLAHMEGLVKTSRDKAKTADSDLAEVQRNYEAQIAELEGTLHRKDKEIAKNKASLEELRRAAKDLKSLVTEKSEEVSMLQDVVRKECIERTLLKQELTTLQNLYGGGTVFDDST
jgi:chromosome segregation ATPase